MADLRARFLQDAPVRGIEANLLWAEDTRAMNEVSEIAHAVICEEGCLAFAVHGQWGAGKTSFLRMVEDTILQSKGKQEITFCRYNASTYQNSGTAATTLALRIWTALRGDRLPDYQAGDQSVDDNFEHYMRIFFADDDWQAQSDERYSILQRWARKTGELLDYPQFLEEVLCQASLLSSKPRKLVLVVDDLDRCRSSFVAEVMDALQRLSLVKHLFVLIGIDREVLLTAIRERYAEVTTNVDEHLALEKYVQYAVDLPPLTPDLLTRYVQKCLEQETNTEEIDSIDRAVLAAIAEDAAYFVAGVRIKTPRAIKRSINAIRPTLRLRLTQDAHLSVDERRLIIKEQLLGYNWRPFYQQFFLPALRDPRSAEYTILSHLERLCAQYYAAKAIEGSPEMQRDRRALFDLQLERIKTREFSQRVSLDVPDELAGLLAQPPYWFYGRERARPTAEQADILDVDLFGGTNPDEEFTRYYIMSEQADAAGDARASVQAAAHAYDLVLRNKGAFGKSTAPQLGNMGVNAEKHKAIDLAERIWRLALELDPEHSGTLQQFASYIIDNKPELFDEAEAILDRLRTGPHTSHRPWRTLGLLAQLRAAQGEDLEPELVERMQEAVRTESDPQQFGYLLDALIRAGIYREAVAAFADGIESISSLKARYTVQRVVADALARRSEAESEFMAVDLYRQILANPGCIDPGDEPHVQANLATLLYKHDYDNEAGCLWFHAYSSPIGRGSASIRRAYAMYVLRTERKDVAEKIIQGEPVDEMVLISTDKVLPERFTDVPLSNALGNGGAAEYFHCLDPDDLK